MIKNKTNTISMDHPYGNLSARNILLRHHLIEKKRFDSADYAMERFQTNETTTNPHISSQLDNETLNGRSCKQSIPTGNLGAVAFVEGLADHDETATAVISILSPKKSNEKVAQYLQSTNFTSSKTSQSDSNVRYGGLSAKNILIRKKLAEKQRFDSADYQLRKLNQGSSPIDYPGTSSESFNVTNPMPTSSSNSRLESNTRTDSNNGPSKYGELSARNILIRKKLSEKKRFDSADYHLKKYENRNTTTCSSTISKGTSKSSSYSTDSNIKNSISNTTSSVDVDKKYGKLCASNILIRKKLAEKKKYDSADHPIKGNPTTPIPMNSFNSKTSDTSMDDLRPALSVKSYESTISSNTDTPEYHIMMNQTQKCQADESKKQSQKSNTNPSNTSNSKSPYGDLCARNVLLRKKLSEKKRFDSADYYAAKNA